MDLFVGHLLLLDLLHRRLDDLLGLLHLLDLLRLEDSLRNGEYFGPYYPFIYADFPDH